MQHPFLERMHIMDAETLERYTSVSAITIFAALHGWLGWLIVLYRISMGTDWLTGTILAIKNKEWRILLILTDVWRQVLYVLQNWSFTKDSP